MSSSEETDPDRFRGGGGSAAEKEGERIPVYVVRRVFVDFCEEDAGYTASLHYDNGGTEKSGFIGSGNVEKEVGLVNLQAFPYNGDMRRV